jgi:hypothetical protein
LNASIFAFVIISNIYRVFAFFLSSNTSCYSSYRLASSLTSLFEFLLLPLSLLMRLVFLVSLPPLKGPRAFACDLLLMMAYERVYGVWTVYFNSICFILRLLSVEMTATYSAVICEQNRGILGSVHSIVSC